jgi:peptidoglycan/LPS O-acetylase OafA/YrhL
VKRYAGLDVLRGLGIMGVVFLHSALYHFANLRSIDFENPTRCCSAT